MAINKFIPVGSKIYFFRLYEHKRGYSVSIRTEKGWRMVGSLSYKTQNIISVLTTRLNKYLKEGIGARKLKPLYYHISTPPRDLAVTIEDIYRDVMQSLGYPAIGNIVVGVEGDYLYIREDYEGRPGHEYSFEIVYDIAQKKITGFYKKTSTGYIKDCIKYGTDYEKEAKERLEDKLRWFS